MSNPYAPPTAELHEAASGAPEDAEAVRRAHLHHEGALRGLGRVFQVLGWLSLPWGPLMAAMGAAVPFLDDTLEEEAVLAAVFFVVMGVFMGVAAALQIWVGTGMRRYKRSVRIPAAIIAVLQLLNIPWGTFLGGATLWALFDTPAERIFAPDYPAIVAATPHLQPGTHKVVWFVVASFVGFMALLVIAVAVMVVVLGSTTP